MRKSDLMVGTAYKVKYHYLRGASIPMRLESNDGTSRFGTSGPFVRMQALDPETMEPTTAAAVKVNRLEIEMPWDQWVPLRDQTAARKRCEDAQVEAMLAPLRAIAGEEALLDHRERYARKGTHAVEIIEVNEAHYDDKTGHYSRRHHHFDIKLPVDILLALIDTDELPGTRPLDAASEAASLSPTEWMARHGAEYGVKPD